jgi:uncharacterized repeat protein (TIGR01451 family)
MSSFLVLAVLVVTTGLVLRAGHYAWSASGSRWVATYPIPESNGLSALSIAAAGEHIYAVGGSYGPAQDEFQTVYSNVYSATVQFDGSLSGWDRDDFLVPLAYASAAIGKNSVYLTGGCDGPNIILDIYCGDFSTGVITGWRTATVAGDSFMPRYGHTSTIVGDELYVLGGWNGVDVLADVAHATVGVNGNCSTGDWDTTSSLEPASGRMGHSTVEFQGRIYVISGLGDDFMPLPSVYYAKPTESGTITQWIQTAPLTQGLAYAAAIVVMPTRRIYLSGGAYPIGDWNNTVVTDSVYFSYINYDGTLSGWRREPSLKLPIPLFRHSMVARSNGSLYIIGGQQSLDDIHTSNVYYIPPLTLTKSNDPSGPVHEGDVITYTISYANTGLITQTNVVITDKVPSNTDLVIGSISSDGRLMQNGVISWTFESLAVGETGAVSFQVRIPLLRHLDVESVSPLCTPEPPPPPPARVLPAAVSCDTTRFWASGITRQPAVTPPYTIEVQIPPNTSPSEMWLLMKGTDNTAPRVEGQPAQVLTSTHTAFGASVWTATVTSAMIEAGEVTVVTDNPRELNALFLFDAKDPPFDERDLRVFAEAPTTFTYTLEIPSVEASSMDVLLPFMDITSWTDSSPPEFDGRMIAVSVKLEGEPTQTITVNQPNMGNGLLMTQFPINLRPFTDTITKTKVLTISVDSEDDAVYTLGPRVCRPVYVENTAWLCSDQAGCISDTAVNIPPNFAPPSLYLPIILKSYP